MAYWNAVSHETAHKRAVANRRRALLEDTALTYQMANIEGDPLCEALKPLQECRGTKLRITYCDVMKQFDIRMGQDGHVYWEVSTKRLSIDKATSELRDQLWKIVITDDDLNDAVEDFTADDGDYPEYEEPLFIIEHNGHKYPCFTADEAHLLLRRKTQESIDGYTDNIHNCECWGGECESCAENTRELLALENADRCPECKTQASTMNLSDNGFLIAEGCCPGCAHSQNLADMNEEYWDAQVA